MIYLKKYLKSFFKRNPPNNIKKSGDYFFQEFGNLKIYTHDMACIDRAFNQIFKKHSYAFKCEVDNPVIIDAGANIGMAVLYWKTKYPKSIIIAFEPSKLAFDSLVKNVQENNLENVTCINKALSDAEGTQQFTTNEIISGSLNTSKDLEFNYKVDTTTLGKYLEQNIDFLKIDIEGAEKFVYKDIKKHISKLNYVFLEYHSFVNEPQYLSNYLNLFEENNFRYYIEGESFKDNHFIEKRVSLNQDMKLNIWASNIEV
jgi:FkbM family methyltransferase